MVAKLYDAECYRISMRFENKNYLNGYNNCKYSRMKSLNWSIEKDTYYFLTSL